MTRRRVFSSLFLFFIFLMGLGSCRDAGYLLDSGSQVEIQTPDDGSIFQAGEKISVGVLAQKTRPAEQVLFKIYDGSGRLAAEREYLEPSRSALPLELSEDLAEGFYRLSIKVFGGGDLLGEKELPFFVLSDSPELSRLISNPAVFLPGGEGIVFAEGYFPKDTDPWIRWRLEDRIIQELPVSRQGDRVTIRASEVPGAYSLRAEIFPQAPPPGETWSFSSTKILEKTIFSSQDVDPGQNGLPYQGSWYSLFHFYGETADWGSRSDPLTLTNSGGYTWALRQGLFGYQGAGGRPLKADGFLFPVSSEGRLEPFSLCLNFFLDETPVSRTFLESSTKNGGFEFRFFSDQDGVASLSIKTSGSSSLAMTLTSLEPWERGLYKPLVISVYPDYRRRELSVFWYENGKLISTAKSSWNAPSDFSPEGTTLINTGPAGMDVLDELGIYYRDQEDRPSPVPGIFHAYSRANYGNRLFYADGFDSLELRTELQELKDYNQGEWELLFNRLGLFPGALFHLPGFALEEGAYSGSVVVSPDSGGNIFLQLREMEEGGSRLVAEIPLASKGSGENQIRFELRPDRKEVFLNGRAYELPQGVRNGTKICWALSNRGEGILFAREIVIVKDILHLELGSLPEEEPGDPSAG